MAYYWCEIPVLVIMNIMLGIVASNCAFTVSIYIWTEVKNHVYMYNNKFKGVREMNKCMIGLNQF